MYPSAGEHLVDRTGQLGEYCPEPRAGVLIISLAEIWESIDLLVGQRRVLV
jgi:hypothetical protein